MDYRKELGGKVAETIKQKETSLNKLSGETGIPYVTLHRKVNGQGDFTIREMSVIAKALGITLGELIPTKILDAAA